MGWTKEEQEGILLPSSRCLDKLLEHPAQRRQTSTSTNTRTNSHSAQSYQMYRPLSPRAQDILQSQSQNAIQRAGGTCSLGPGTQFSLHTSPYSGSSGHKGMKAKGGPRTLNQACYRAFPGSAMCVQNFDDSRSPAIRITYRISLRSSSLWEPRHPSLKVVFTLLIV